MKKTLLPITVLALLAASCSMEEAPIEVFKPADNGEIVLGLGGDMVHANVETKGTNITSVPSTLYLAITTGTAGSAETSKMASTSKSVTSSTISTGLYQTFTPTSYNYYVANQAITFAAAGSTLAVSGNGTDIIAGHANAITSTTPSVTLSHVFAAMGALSTTGPSGYTVSNVSYKIVGKSDINGTAGTYSLQSDSWTAASTKLSTATSIVTNSNTYYIPGTYTLSVTYTLTKDDWTNTYTKSADIVIEKGKTNNVTATIPVPNPGAVGIEVSVSLTSWGNLTLTPTLK